MRACPWCGLRLDVPFSVDHAVMLTGLSKIIEAQCCKRPIVLIYPYEPIVERVEFEDNQALAVARKVLK